MPSNTPRAIGLLSPLARRRAIDALLDRLRFTIDTTSRRGNYQPLPGLAIRKVARDNATRARWDAMRPLVEELGTRSAVDVGCNAGFFPLQFGLMGIPAIGIEGEPVNFRTFMYAAQRLGLEAMGQVHMWVTPDTVSLVPAADCLILLAVWHHFVQRFGVEGATTMQHALWERTGKVLFFETGEAEVATEYGLPDMGQDTRAWLIDYLRHSCPGGDVRHLGQYEARSPIGQPCMRNVFAVVRTQEPRRSHH